jgi:hypothetical protein
MVLAALVAAGELAGCAGITNPYQTRRAVTRTAVSSALSTPADVSDPAPERGGTVPPSARTGLSTLAAGAGASNPEAALARYAQLYVNWSAATAAASQRRLAAISLGQARAQALQAAADLARDPELTKSKVLNAGAVVGIADGQGAATGEWVIVTREQTSGQGDYAGLPPTLHVIYARVTATKHGFVVSQWQPQN